MRNRYVLFADLLLIASAAFGAFALRFDLLFTHERPEFVGFLAAALLLKPTVFYLFGMYRRYWRYATAQDVVAVVLAASAASIVVAMYVVLGSAFGLIGEFSRQVLFIDWLLTLIATGGMRMSVRVIGDARRRAEKEEGGQASRRVLVIGAGEAGVLVVREMRKNPQLGRRPVGLLDDDPVKRGKMINGVRVLGSLDALGSLLPSRAIDEVVIAMPAAPGALVRGVAEQCRRAGVPSRIVPGVFEVLGGQITVSHLRNVEITDLLRREPVADDERKWTAAYVQGRAVLISGAGGSIGSELARQVAHAGPAALLLLGHGENSIFETAQALRRSFPGIRITTLIADIRDSDRIESLFRLYRPAIVLHAAAHKHVTLMEENPVEAVSNNVLGTHIVASAAIRHGAQRFVLVSTDKAVAPTSIMGATKRMAEIIVRNLERPATTKVMVVRFGNVLGSRGSVVPIFKSQIESGGPVTITHPEARRYFMTIPEAVHLVLRAAEFNESATYVLDMGTPVKIRDLAEDLIRLSGFSVNEIPIVFTGLRPGEKLEEALWEAPGHVDRTAHRSILRVSGERDGVDGPVSRVVARFEVLARTGHRLELEAALAEQIPTFVPGVFTSSPLPIDASKPVG